MTSVGVISGAEAAIVEANPQESLPAETGNLLAGLQHLKEFFLNAYSRKEEAKFVEGEKKAVRLSYEIVDAIADASSIRPKEKFSILHRPKKTAGNTKQQLGQLQSRLKALQGQLTGETAPSVSASGQLQSQKSSSLSSRKSTKASKEVQKIDPKIGSISQKVTEGSIGRSEQAGLSDLSIQPEHDQPSSTMPPASSEQEPPPSSSESNPMERKDSYNLLTQKLMKEDSFSELYLVGKSGMGKTTLARKLFYDDQLRTVFKSFAWVPITRNFQIRRVFQLLLQQLGPGPSQVDVSEIDLIPLIFDRLKASPYLLVLDDIESMDDWESIRLALPTSTLGKVVITSSSMDIARGKEDRRHLVSGLHETEVAALFKHQTASISDEACKAICDISGGSPLFATILGRSLQSAGENKENDEKKKIEKKFVGELRSCDSSIKGTPQALEASYKKLSHQMKPILLYLGQFPAGQDVDIDKLYLLLAAENLIKDPENLIKDPKLVSPASSKELDDRKELGKCLKELDDRKELGKCLKELDDWKELGKCLKKLDDWKFVEVQRDHLVPTREPYKSCRLHEQVWEFCRSTASSEEFARIVDFGSSTPENAGSIYIRRLALYLRGDAKSAARSIGQETLKKLWTLVIVDTFEKKSRWPSELNDLTESSYLRILSFDGVDFVGSDRKLPKGLDRLVFLKYLSFRGCRLETLPPSLVNLALLETLDLLVRDDCTVIIPSNIFANKKQMLHLYFPRKYQSDSGGDGGTKLKLQCMKKLKTLVNFDTEACDVEDLKQLSNLKILSSISKERVGTALLEFFTQASGKELLQYSAVDITSFDRYDSSNLSELERLLSCPSVHSVRVEGRIGELPREVKEAVTIREIVLDGSQLQLDPVKYLGKFENLQGLVLSNNAFMGIEFTIPPTLFPKLRSLRIHNLKSLKKLTIEDEAMPNLSSLQVHSCAHLSELYIPKELHDRLRQAYVENGDDAYSIAPVPSTFKATLGPVKFAMGRLS